MKNKIFSSLLVGLMAFMVSCDPMIEDDYNLGVPPSASDIQYSVSFDENNGDVTFEVTNQQAVGVWYFPTSDPSAPEIKTGNKVTRKYMSAGTFTISVAMYNKAGVSDKKEVTFDAPGANPTYLIADKTWMWDKETPGHIGNGPADATSAQWWVAGPNEQDPRLYDDEMIFHSDGSYELKAHGYILCNEGAAYHFGIEGATAGVIVPYEQPAGQTWAITAEGSKLFLSFTGDGFPSYIPGDNWGSLKYEILNISETNLDLKVSFGWGAFFMKFISK